MLSIKDISKIQKPIVWTTHDSWICCGAEHHPNILENDSRYINGYSKKNKPLTTKGIDICKKIWLKKKKYLNKKNITFIAGECQIPIKIFGKQSFFIFSGSLSKN